MSNVRPNWLRKGDVLLPQPGTALVERYEVRSSPDEYGRYQTQVVRSQNIGTRLQLMSNEFMKVRAFKNVWTRKV